MVSTISKRTKELLDGRDHDSALGVRGLKDLSDSIDRFSNWLKKLISDIEKDSTLTEKEIDFLEDFIELLFINSTNIEQNLFIGRSLNEIKKMMKIHG